MKPHSPACERNREPIREQLARLLPEPARILEIGSGTGQHAAWFTTHLPHLTWQTSDLPINHEGITTWMVEAGNANLLAPIVLDVDGSWPEATYDAVFTANTFHIVSAAQTRALIRGAAGCLGAGGLLLVYGPFLIDGVHTSDSNRNFDKMLRARDPQSGIRDREELIAFARGEGFNFREDIAMPANNRILVWQKETANP